jgi:hypothetical protein
MLHDVDELPPGERQPSGWLPDIRVGNEYDVLVFSVDDRDQALLRLDIGDSPPLYDRRMFVTTSSRIPANWVATVDRHGKIEAGPQAWQEDGFWDSYFDGEPAAVQVFMAERAKIRQES